MDTTLNRGHQGFLKLLLWCLLLALAWGVWLWQLDASDLTFDESATYFVAYRPPLQILQYLRAAVHEHPPLYYLLIRGWMALAGTSEFSLRFFSVSAGMIVLSLIGWLGRLAAGQDARRFLPRLGLVAAALLAVTPGLIHYVRDARMYTLGIVWTVLAAGLFLRDWLQPKSWPRYPTAFLLMAVNGLALFTHYYLLLPILVQPLVLLVTRRWRPLWIWCAVHSVPALVGLLWIRLATGFQLTAESLWSQFDPALPSSDQAGILLDRIFFSHMIGVQFRILVMVLILMAAGVLVALWRQWRVGVWLATALATPLPIAYLLPLQPAARYLLFLLPFAALAMAYLSLLPTVLSKSRWQGTVGTLGLALLIAWVLAGVGFVPVLTTEKSRYGRTLEMVKAHARPGDEVLFYGPWQEITFHYYDPGGMPPITKVPPYAPPLLKPDEARPVLEELLERSSRLWVLPTAVDDVDPNHFVRDWLQTHAHAVWSDRDFQLYLPPLPPDAPVTDLDLTFGEALRLEQIAFEPQPVPAGEPIRLSLYWRPLQPLENDILLGLSLVDEVGHTWENTYALSAIDGDVPPAIDYKGLMMPQGAPPGNYSVRLMVIDTSADEVLMVEGRDLVVLQTFQVTEPSNEPVLYNPSHFDDATFCDPEKSACLTLTGVDPGGVRFQPGFPIPLTLHWLSPAYALPELRVRLQVTTRPWLNLPGNSGTVVLTRTIPLTESYPTTEWTSDRLVTMPTALNLPLDTPTGRYQIQMEVVGSDGRSWSMNEGGSRLPLFTITMEARPTQRKLPRGLDSIQVDFGDEIGLRGYRIRGSATPGGQLELTYAWYAKARPTAVYAVFNHLFTTDGTRIAQADGWPQEGRLLTTQWQRGEYVEDSHMLEIPPDAPPGPYTLYVGVYNVANVERLPAFQAGQRLPNDQVPISLPGPRE